MQLLKNNTDLAAGLLKAVLSVSDGAKGTVTLLNCESPFLLSEILQHGIKCQQVAGSVEELDALVAMCSSKEAKHISLTMHKQPILFVLAGSSSLDAVPTDSKLAIVSNGFDNWDSVCLHLASYLRVGASTVQYGSAFLTLGYKL